MKVVLIYAQLNRPYFFPPMGIVCLGTQLRAKGIDVKLIDPTFDCDLQSCAEQVKEAKPDLIGISCLTINYPTAMKIAGLCKQLYPQCLVVMGGPHATAMPEQVLGNENIDFVASGEGEQTLLELISHVQGEKEPGSIKSLGYKKGKELVFNEERPVIENLDELPEPDRGLLPTFTKYLLFQTSFPFFMPAGVIIVSRGCPFNCTFCQPMLKRLFGTKVRLRSPELVVKEMAGLVSAYKVKSIYFTDDTFWANPEWAEKVCALIKQQGLDKKIKWLAQTNLVTLDEKRLRLMRDSGCIFLGFGVESGNPFVLKEVFRKAHSVQQAKDIFALCRKLGVVSSANFIIGCAEETSESLRDSLELIRELNPDITDIHYLTPTPGSALYDDYRQKKLLQYQEWSDPDRYTPDLIQMKNIEKGELENYYRRMNEAFLEQKRLWRAHRLWLPYIWNILTITGSFRAFLRVLVLQYLMMNSLFFNWLGKRLLAMREYLRRKQVRG